MPTTWTFYFDFISPYAFLAWRKVRPIAAKNGRVVEPVPVLFAALLDAHGTKGPAEIPAKRRYLGKDVARKAHRLGIADVKPPPAHPFHPLLALRVASVPAPTPVAHEQVIDALFDAVWTKGQAIDTAERVTGILDGAGLDGAALVASAGTSEVKTRLREQTKAAVRKGVFGVPTIEGEGELFWGTDSLEDLDLVAQGLIPASGDVDFDSVPVGIVRTPRNA